MQLIIDPSELEKLRKKANLTQKEVAKLCKVSQSFIAKLERGNLDPTYSKIKAISELLLPIVSKKSKKVGELATRNIIFARKDEKIKDVAKKMAENGISQLPVIDDGKVVGSITEQAIIEKLAEELDENKIMNEKVEKIMEPPFPIIPEDAPLELLLFLLSYYQAVLVNSEGKISGIITKADILQRL